MKKAFYSLLALALPITVGAALPKTVDDVDKLLVGWVDYITALFWIAAFLSGLYAAFKFLAAKGDPKAAEQGKKMAMYTLVAACVALLSTVVKEIATSILGG
ncbi:hypothetical protein KBB41_02325 [Candidatus Curtissbacteria bacterium]|nr:hypothetical protein [Candidatus Curtissbacteria bacterium]